jgi:optic atrophy 3 protein
MSLFLRFGVLFMRTVAKPVSNMVKSTLKDHPTFRRIAIAGARLHSRTNARWDRIVRRRPITDKKGNPIQRRELTETEAIDLAADILGEAFLL